MPRLIHRFLALSVAFGALASAAAGQSNTKTAPADSTSSAQKGLSLVEEGRCREALPILRKAAPLTSDKELKRKVGLATIRCGLSLNQTDAAVNALLWLNREFPSDAEVLYVTTHAYSDLST